MSGQLETDTNTLHHDMHQGHKETFDEKDLTQTDLFALTPN